MNFGFGQGGRLGTTGGRNPFLKALVSEQAGTPNLEISAVLSPVIPATPIPRTAVPFVMRPMALAHVMTTRNRIKGNFGGVGNRYSGSGGMRRGMGLKGRSLATVNPKAPYGRPTLQDRLRFAQLVSSQRPEIAHEVARIRSKDTGAVIEGKAPIRMDIRQQPGMGFTVQKRRAIEAAWLRVQRAPDQKTPNKLRMTNL